MGELWEPGQLPGRWRPLLMQALQLKLQDRPPDVRAWWGSDDGLSSSLPTPAADTMSVQIDIGRFSQTGPSASGGTASSITNQHPLALALARATPGSIVRVPAGTHRLGRGLLLRKAVTLITW